MKNRHRKIAVVTGSRSDYGILFWLLKDIQQDGEVDLQLIVTGQHLSPAFGNTDFVIQKDGFIIDESVDLLLSNDTPQAITKSMGMGLIGFADVCKRLKPDILVLVGDRYEMLVAAQAALLAQIPIAHIHGGETTEGSIDESIRHSITKMAHVHFVSAEPYRKRVIQMGESPNLVFNVGAPGLDHFKRTQLLSKKELEKLLGLTFEPPTFLITYHPVTVESKTMHDSIQNLLNALDTFSNAKIIFTKHNSDPEGNIIGKMIHDYVLKRGDKTFMFTSLGQQLYLSALHYVDAMIGNSSSGIIEMPWLKKPTINIGIRQQGRLKAYSIIDCEDKETAICSAIKKALSVDFQKQLVKTESLYGEGNASEKIFSILKKINLDHILMKKFYNIEYSFY